MKFFNTKSLLLLLALFASALAFQECKKDDDTSDAARSACDPRTTVVRHERNRGVGVGPRRPRLLGLIEADRCY